MSELHHPEHIAPTFVADGNGGVMIVTAICDTMRRDRDSKDGSNTKRASRLEELLQPTPGALHFARNRFPQIGERATLDICINPPIC